MGSVSNMTKTPFAETLRGIVIPSLMHAHDALVSAEGQLHYHLFGDGQKLWPTNEDFIPPSVRPQATELWRLTESALKARGAALRLAFEIEKSLERSPSPNRRKRTSRNARRHRGVEFTVDLKNKPHVEEVKFTDATGARAVLFRSMSPVVEFAPTESQVKKILSGKGKIHIIEGQITARSRWPNVGKLEHNRSKRTSRRAR